MGVSLRRSWNIRLAITTGEVCGNWGATFALQVLELYRISMPDDHFIPKQVYVHT